MLEGQTAAQIIANTLGQVPKGISVSVTAGTISNGGTIPLPSGYTRAQCKYAVWSSSHGRINGDYRRISCSCNQSNGYVESKIEYYDNGGDYRWDSITAGYLCIAVK